jgi:hypothetical protein
VALASRVPALRRASEIVRGVAPSDLASLACLGILSWVMLVTLPDYGLTYDEEPHIRYGERVLDFYANGFRGSGRLQRSSYGAGFDLLAALLRRVSPWDPYRTNHVLSVFVAQLGLLGTWQLGRLVAGPLGALLSLGFLVLTPVYDGHQFNNPKDIPFAVGYVWGLYFIARLLSARSDDSPATRAMGLRYWLGLAVALGLGMSVRVGGAILLVYLFLFLVLLGLDRWRLAGRSAAFELRRDLLFALLAALGGWLLMMAFWPRALEKPLDGPAAALETVSRFTAYDSPTLLGGELISSHRVPWDYLPTYFAVQLPELTLVCLVLASLGVCVQTGFALWRGSRIPWVWSLLAFAVWVPPAYAIVRHSHLYNGLRHFLFIIPPISVLAGSGVASFARAVARRKAAFGVITACLLGLFAIDQLHALWRLHPHQHVFFNRASGGLVPAVERYETEYYGSVYQELHAKLREHVWAQHRDTYLSTIFTVAGCGSKLFFTKNLPLNFQYQAMRNARRADFYATYVRDRCLRNFRNHPVVAEVERDGATLAVARDLKRKLPPRPSARGPERP